MIARRACRRPVFQCVLLLFFIVMCCSIEHTAEDHVRELEAALRLKDVEIAALRARERAPHLATVSGGGWQTAD